MTTTASAPNWPLIMQALAQPYDPREVKFFPKTVAKDGAKALMLAYVDARAVMNRLDAVVGPENWSFDWEPVLVERGALRIAKGKLTIYGITKCDVGDESNMEPTKGTVGDALKRAGAQWSIGRYLYAIKSTWVAVEGDDKNKRPTAQALQQLRAALPRPNPAVLAAARAVDLPAHLERVEDDDDDAGAGAGAQTPETSEPAAPRAPRPAPRPVPPSAARTTSEEGEQAPTARDPKAPASDARVQTLRALYDKAGHPFPYMAEVKLTNAMVDSAIEKLKKMGTARQPVAAGA